MYHKTFSSPACSCIKCKKVFSQKGIHSHYLTAHTTTPNKGSVFIKELAQNKQAEYNLHPFYCLLCGTTLSFDQRNNKFCSNSCAATFNNTGRKHTAKTKEKISAASKGHLPTLPKFTQVTQCKICRKWFKGRKKTCSKECLKQAQVQYGKKSAKTQKRRSKDEIKLFELCTTIFKHVEHNVSMFNGWDADIIIHDTRTAVLWNGPWHYQEMSGFKHSLEQVQTRDKIKIKEIIAMGWNPVVFEDRFFTPESALDVLVARQGYDPCLPSYELGTLTSELSGQYMVLEPGFEPGTYALSRRHSTI